MRWFLIVKNPTPTTQTEYSGWKGELRQEGREQCCYCTISENAFGGGRNFAVEHYRPKSRFVHLTVHYPNLFYACAVCNSFKGDDWPTDTPAPDVACYLDPSAHDYTDHIAVDTATGLVSGINVAGRYKVQRLHLNRAQLILYRRRETLLERARRFEAAAANLLQHADALGVGRLRRLMGAVLRISAMRDRVQRAAPYEDGDLRDD